jgi:amino acid transporter
MSAQRDPWGERLPRSVGLWGAVMMLVGTTIGSGIFRVPALVAERTGEPVMFLGVWVVGGLLALFGALTLAELAVMFPRSGGVLAFLEEGVGPLPAFLFGWSQLVVIRASALGAISTIFAEYLGRLLQYSGQASLSPRAIQYVAAGVILTVATLNYIGVRRAAAFMTAASLAWEAQSCTTAALNSPNRVFHSRR